MARDGVVINSFCGVARHTAWRAHQLARSSRRSATVFSRSIRVARVAAGSDVSVFSSRLLLRACLLQATLTWQRPMKSFATYYTARVGRRIGCIRACMRPHDNETIYGAHRNYFDSQESLVWLVILLKYN